MVQDIFITGIGTGVGKTIVAAIVTEALQAVYWKPLQAGYEDGTDTEWVRSVLSNPAAANHPESYKLKMAVSPHISARTEGIHISTPSIKHQLMQIKSLLPADGSRVIIEGAGGLLVPLNANEFVADLIQQLKVKVILVSRNYLGSINHSLLTAAVCKQYKLDVLGWIFNDQYLAYEDEIVNWSGFPKIATIPFSQTPGKLFVTEQAALISKVLNKMI